MKKHYITNTLLIASLIIGGAIFFNSERKSEFKIDNPYQYLPDTIYVESDYSKEIETLREVVAKLAKTPPKTIYHYEKPVNTSTTIEKIPDSLLLYIGDLQERLAISDEYIKNFPKSDKLVDFKLQRDDFSISTLNISGELKKAEYPLYLDDYNYYWVDNELSHEKRDKPYRAKDPNKWKQLYINGGYLWTDKIPKAGLDYSLILGRFKVGSKLDVTIETDPTLYGTVDLGFRLLK